MRETDTEASDLTVPQLVRDRWGSDLSEHGLLQRFTEPGWTYQEQLPRPCPDCNQPLHSLRRPYESGFRQYRYVAVVCPACPRAFTLADLGAKTYDKLLPVKPTAAPTALAPWRAKAAPTMTVRAASRLLAGLDTGPCADGPGVTVTAIRLPHPSRESAPAGPAWPEDLPLPAQKETRALWWGKITNPAWNPPEPALRAADDARVIVPVGERFDDLRDALTGLGAQVRVAAHWVEDEFEAPTRTLRRTARTNSRRRRNAPVAAPAGPSRGRTRIAGNPLVCEGEELRTSRRTWRVRCLAKGVSVRGGR